MIRWLLVFIFFCSGLAVSAQAPLQFVPNEGQWEQPFYYKSSSQNADIYLEKSGITYCVGAGDNYLKVHDYKEGIITQRPVLKFHGYKMEWIGTNENVATVPSKKLKTYNNYFLGNDSSHWKGNVPVYMNVDYKNLYDNIDLHIGSENGNPKYDFIVGKNANADLIQLQYTGLNKVKIEKGNLVLYTSVGEVTEMKPYAYQYQNGYKKEISCQYKLNGNQISFYFPEGYNHDEILTIDPTIVFASLTGSTADNWGFTATYDLQGNLYAGGIVGGPGYPIQGAYQLTFAGGTGSIINGLPCDISISKFTSDGTNLIYSTYIGGSDNEMPHSMVVDAQGNLVIAGKSFSSNYPVTNGAYDESHNGLSDIIVTKLNAAGNNLVGSTFVGGNGQDGVNIAPDYSANQNSLRFNYGDNARSEVIVDKQGNIYVASCTQSAGFPVTPNAVKSTMTDVQDGVVFKLNPTLTQLTWSTFLGGSSNDAAYVLALDTSQKFLYVAGGTQSTNLFPSTTAGSIFSTYQGGLADGFICRFRNGGTYNLTKTTYLGTSQYDQCYGIQIDLENNVYAMGQTMGSFPVTPGVYSNAGSPQFLIKVDSLLSTNIYSTVWGSGPSAAPNVSPVAFLVDTCQNVYISGWGGLSPGTSTNNLPITPDAFQSTTDGFDFYFIVFEKNALGLLFCSFFGNNGKHEHVDGGTSRFNPQGEVYQAICASCAGGTGFPASPGAWSAVNGSPNCNLGAVKIAFNLGSVNAEAGANPNATGCAPLTVNFSNESSNATSYEWHFDDGSAVSNATAPIHTYTNPGVYNVMMIAINPNACKVRDTVYLTITVSDAEIHADFNLTKTDSCNNFSIALANNSTPVPGGSLAQATFQWDFGDGTTYTGATPPTHTYANEGTYQVRMIMMYPDACNSPDTVIKSVTFDIFDVAASFTAPNACSGLSTAFTNTSSNATTWHWDFGDGNTSDEESPSHQYAIGEYHITLISGNPESCNKFDTFTYTITVHPNPTADFLFTPIQPETNKPTTFINQSQGATLYGWDFGDGNITNEENPVHQYDKTGSFNVCLTATNEYGCSDKKCKTVYSDVLPLADVPTGFTPNGDGNNDIIFVRGFAIQTIDFKIFNRWGQLVFESTNAERGWDGTFNGKPQEMDSYAFLLNVTFKDGTHLNKKGNITLIR